MTIQRLTHLLKMRVQIHHDVDNGEQPDNGDDTSSNDEDNHSSDDTNGNDEGIEPPYEVDGDIFEDDSDEVISDRR